MHAGGELPGTSQRLDHGDVDGGLSIVLRTPQEPRALVQDVRRELARMDPGVAPANPRALGEAMAGSMTERRVVLGLIAASP